MYFYPYYIKKEDARNLIKTHRIMIAMVIFSVALVLGILRVLVYSPLAILYQEVNVTLPFTTQFFPQIVTGLFIFSIILGVYFIKVQPSQEELNKKLSKYIDGEMIKTSDILSLRLVVIILSLVGIMIGFLIVSIISPIYTLTNQF